MEKYIKEILYITDWYTDELFINGIGKPLVAPVSKLLCDMKEEMSVVGMGICYTCTHDLQVLSEYRLEHKGKIIQKYYDPYHQMLTNYAAEAIIEHKCALLIDCHSFSSSTNQCERKYSWDRPDICIGTDPDNTPEDFTSTVKDYFEGLNYTVKLNEPISGTFIPESFQKDPRLLSIKIGVKRSLYLEWKDKELIKKEEEFKILKGRICELEKLLENYMTEKSQSMKEMKSFSTIPPFNIKIYV